MAYSGGMATSREEELKLLFTDARSHSAWLDKPIDDALLHKLYELTSAGPTSANTQPIRIVFVKSHEAKEKLRPALRPQNVEKTMTAPVAAILAFDPKFFDKIPQLFPARPEYKDVFGGLPEPVRNSIGTQSATLQAGYFILAARALGLDCGPIAGYDGPTVDQAFFPDGAWKSILLVNLGYGDHSKLFPRNPRLSFEEACRIE